MEHWHVLQFWINWLSHLGKKESTKMYKVFSSGQSKSIRRKMLHHQKFKVNGPRWWHHMCRSTSSIYATAPLGCTLRIQIIQYKSKGIFNPCLSLGSYLRADQANMSLFLSFWKLMYDSLQAMHWKFASGTGGYWQQLCQSLKDLFTSKSYISYFKCISSQQFLSALISGTGQEST